jgi:hypothetical protein
LSERASPNRASFSQGNRLFSPAVIVRIMPARSESSTTSSRFTRADLSLKKVTKTAMAQPLAPHSERDLVVELTS